MQQMRRTYQLHEATHLGLDQKVGAVLPHGFNAVENVSPAEGMHFIATSEQIGNRVAPNKS
jgi:hypothetical protein